MAPHGERSALGLIDSWVTRPEVGPPPATSGGGLVAERANSSSEPCNQFASLAAKRSVIHKALLVAGVARRFRVGLQENQHGLKRLRALQQVHRSLSNARTFTNMAFIGFAACGKAVSPQLVRAQRGGANPDKMFHRYGAPKAGLRRNTLWNRQPRHGDQIAAVEIGVQKRTAAGVIFADEHQSGAVELHIIEQPSVHRRQIGDGLDVMIAPTSEQPHPPAAALLAKEKDPIGLDQGGESFLLATIFLTNDLRCSRVRLVSF
jgi:hypothetical protein